MKYLLKRILQVDKAKAEDLIVNVILMIFFVIFVAFIVFLQVLGL
jgi:hypothetical protein